MSKKSPKNTIVYTSRFRKTLVLSFVLITATVSAAFALNVSGSSITELLLGKPAAAAFLTNVPTVPLANDDRVDSPAGKLQFARQGHTSTALADGRILTVGGDDVGSSEIYDPISGVSTVSGYLSVARTGHTATLMSDGRVLIVGGNSAGSPVTSTEIYDNGTFSAGPGLAVARAGHTATQLADGRIVIAGGDARGSVEIVDAAAKASQIIKLELITPRSAHSAELLKNGEILLVGGLTADGTAVKSGELLNATTTTVSMVGRELHSARVQPLLRQLPDGKVQIIGGNDEGSMEMFTPLGNYFSGYAHVIPGRDAKQSAAFKQSGKPAGVVDDARATEAESHVMRTATRAALINNGEANDSYLNRTGFAIVRMPGTTEVMVTGGKDAKGSSLKDTLVFRESTATITTDRLDYWPGETVIVSGTGWEPGEAVQMTLVRDPVFSGGEILLSSVADENGDFTNKEYVVSNEDLGASFVLTAVGQRSGQTAQTTFTDGSEGFEGYLNISNAWGGTANGNNSKYSESQVVPVRFELIGLAAGTHTINLKYDFFKDSSPNVHFIDQLTSPDTDFQPNELQALTGGYTTFTSKAIPADTFAGATPPANSNNIPSGGTMKIYLGTGAGTASIGSFSSYSSNGGVRQLSLNITITGGTKNVLLVYGGHLASPLNWGAGNGAYTYPGGSGKFYANLDNGPDKNFGLQSSAVIPQTTLSFNAITPSTSVYGSGTTTLTATLINASSNTPISGSTVSFYLNNSNPDNTTTPNGSSVGSAITDANGIATLNVTTPFANLATKTVSGSPYSMYVGGTYAGTTGIGSSFGFGSMAITPKPATITANNANKAYGTTATFASNAFTSSGLVTTNGNGDSISGVTETSTGSGYSSPVGTYPIVITPGSQTGTGLSNYSFTYIDGTLTVTEPTLTITATNQSKTYGDVFVPNGATQFTTSGLQPGDSVTSVTLMSSGYAANAGIAGSPYTITPSAAAGTGLSNYTIVYNDGSLTVNAKPLTITATDQSKSYGTPGIGSNAPLFATSAMVGSESVSSVTRTSSGSAAIAAATTYPIVITEGSAVAGAGTDLSNYAISYMDGTLTITPATADCTVTPYDVPYDGNEHNATGSCTGVGGGDISGGLTINSAHTDAGIYTDSWSFALANYTSIGSTPITDKISQVAVTATAGSYSGVYDGNTHPLTACAVTGFAGLSCTNSPAGPVGPGVGGAPVTPDVSGISTTNFIVTPVNGSWSITPATADCTVTPYDVPYDGNEHNATGSCTGVGGGDISGGLTINSAHTDAGIYTDSWSFALANYTSIGSTPITDKISQVAVTATAGSYSGVYDGNTHPLTACAVTGFAGLSCTNSPAGPVGPGVGGAPVTPDVSGISTTNFIVTPVNGSWSITPATADCTVTPYDVPYDGNEHNATGSCTGVGGGDISGGLTINSAHTDAGIYTDSWSFALANYTSIGSTPITDKISQVAVTATAGSYSGVYDGNTHPLTACAVTGFAGLSCTNSPAGPVGPGVGGAPVTPDVSGISTTNFIVTPVNGSWSITPATADCTVTPYDVPYDGNEHNATGSCTGVGGGDISGGLTINSAHTDAGIYTDSWSFALANYTSIGSTPITDKISQVAVTATAGSYSGVYDGNTHPLTACAVTGFAGLSCTNSPAGPVGPGVGGAPVTPDVSGISTTNFIVTPVNGSWSITPATADCTVTPYDVPYDGNEHNATGSCTGVGGGDISGGLTINSAHTDAGIYTDSWSFALANYTSIGSTPITDKISQVAVTATAGSYSGVYDGNTHPLTACAVTGFAGLSCTNSPAGPVGPGVGGAPVTPDVSGISTTNFIVTPVNGSWSITPATADCTVTPYDVPYDGNEHNATGSCTGVGGGDISGGLTINSAHTDAGIYTDSWSFALANYTSIGSTPITDKISQVAVTATAGSYSGVYDGNTHPLTACAVTGFAGLSCTNSPAGPVGPGVGGAPVTPDVSGISTTNFIVTPVNGSWSITPATADCTVTPYDVPYDGNEHNATGSCTGVGGGDISGGLTINSAHTDAGIYTDSWSFALANYTSIGSTPITDKISQVAVTATAGSYSGVYDGNTHPLTACAVTGFAGLSCTNSPAGPVGPGVGGAPVTPDVSGISTTNFIVTPVNGSWSITPATADCTVTPYDVPYDGNEHNATGSCTGVGGGDISGGLTINSAHTDAGIYTDSWSFALANYTSIGSTPITDKISQVAVTATAGSYSGVYDGNTHPLTACAVTGFAGLSCTNSPAGPVGPGVGGAPVTPDVSGISTTNFIVTPVNGSWSITPATADCTVTPYDVPYDGNEHNATGSCTGVGGGDISGGLTINSAHTDAGIYTDSWSFALANYTSIGSTPITDKISQVAVTATAGSYSGVYDGNTHPLTACAVTGFAGLSCTNSPAGPVGPGVGGAPVTPDVSGISTTNFIVTPVNGSWSITPATADCTVTPYDVPYDGNEHNATGSCTGVGGGDISGGLTINSAHTDAGIYTDSWSFALANYTSIGSTPITDKISQVAVTATAGSYSGVYDGNTHPLTACAVTGFAGLSCTNSPAGPVGPGVGGAPVTPDVSGISTTNFIVTPVNGSWSITPATADCTVTPYDVPYDGNEHNATGSCTGVGGGDISGGLTINSAHTDAGIYTDSWSFALANYTSIGSTPITDKISQVAVTATAGSYSGVYDGNTHPLTACAVTGFAGLSCTNSPAGPVGPGVGGAPVTPDVSGISTTNFIVTPVNGSWSITPATADCTVTPYDVPYDGNEHNATGSCTGVGGGDISGGLTINSAHTDAGIYTDSWSFALANYTSIGSTPITDKISQVAVTATAGSYSGVYDGNTHPLTACAVTGFAGLSCTNSPAGPVGPGVGGAPVTPDVSGISTTNFIVTPVNGSWSITPATADCTVTPYDVPYDGNEHNATGSCTGVGGGDISGGLTINSAHTDAGIYTDSWSFALANYTSIGSTPITDKISQVAVTATAGSYSGVYDGNTHPLTACAVTGFAGLSCTNSPAGPVGPGVGGAPVTPDVSGISTTNFIVTPVNGSWSITPATVTATAGSGSSVYDGAMHSPSACAVTGLYKGDLTCANNAAMVGPGVVTNQIINPVVSGSSQSNFLINLVPGSYTITKAPTAITLDQKLSGTNFDCVNNQYTATLKDTYSNIGLAGVSLILTIGTQSTTAITDANGVATFAITLDQTPGSKNESAGLTGAWADPNRMPPATASRSFTIIPSPYAGPQNGTSLYTGPSFSWTTSPTSSTTTLSLNATIKDTGLCPGNIAKATVSFFVSSNNGQSFSPVSSAQNLPVGLVNPADPTVGTAATTSQYNIGSNLAISLVIKVVVGGEYLTNSDEYNVPVIIAVPGQPNTLTAGGKLSNTDTTGLTGTNFPVAGQSYYANGYLGFGNGFTSGGLASEDVLFGGFVKCNNTKCTNPQGQLNAVFKTFNRPDGSVDTAVHSYFMKTNAISGWGTTSAGSGFFTARTNLFETTGGVSNGIDGGGTMQLVFARPGATYTYTSSVAPKSVTLTCPMSATNGCASIILYRSNTLGGGVWFSSAWGPVAAGSLPQTIMKQMLPGGTITYTAATP